MRSKFISIFLILFFAKTVFGLTKVGIGTIYISSKSNLETNYSKIKDYDKPDKTKTDIIPIGELTFTSKYNGAHISSGLGYSEGAKGLFLNYQNSFSNLGKFKVQIAFDPFSKEWKNPYLLNDNREKTDVYNYSLNLELKDIKNTNFLFKYKLRYKDVRKDGIEYSDLKRDTIFKDFILGYSFKTPIRGLILIPEVAFNTSKAKGESNSYYGYGLGFSALLFTRYNKFIIKTNFNQRFFQKTDPVFNKTRKEDLLSLFAVFTFNEPIKIKNTYFTITAGYMIKNTNINFYKESKLFTGLIVGYKF